MRTSYFFNYKLPTRASVESKLHLAARPRGQGRHGHWLAQGAVLPHLRPMQRVAGPVRGACQPQPASTEELTRDLAGWGLPPAAPLGKLGENWLR